MLRTSSDISSNSHPFLDSNNASFLAQQQQQLHAFGLLTAPSSIVSVIQHNIQAFQALEDKYLELQKQFEQQSRYIQSLELKSSNLETTLNAQYEYSQSLEQGRASVHHEWLQKKEQEIGALNTRLQQEQQQNQETIKRTEQQNDNLNIRLQQAQHENQDFRDQIEQLRTETITLNSQLVQCNKDIQRLRTTHSELDVKLQAQSKEYRQCKELLKAEETAKKLLKKENAQLTHQIAQMLRKEQGNRQLVQNVMTMHRENEQLRKVRSKQLDSVLFNLTHKYKSPRMAQAVVDIHPRPDGCSSSLDCSVAEMREALVDIVNEHIQLAEYWEQSTSQKQKQKHRSLGNNSSDSSSTAVLSVEDANLQLNLKSKEIEVLRKMLLQATNSGTDSSHTATPATASTSVLATLFKTMDKGYALRTTTTTTPSSSQTSLSSSLPLSA